MRSMRWVLSVGGLLCAVALAGMSAAWACTGAISTAVLSVDRSLAGQPVTVASPQGGWTPVGSPGYQPVRVSVYDQADVRVATTTAAVDAQGNFSVALVIPAGTAPGDYTVETLQGLTRYVTSFVVLDPNRFTAGSPAGSGPGGAPVGVTTANVSGGDASVPAAGRAATHSGAPVAAVPQATAAAPSAVSAAPAPSNLPAALGGSSSEDLWSGLGRSAATGTGLGNLGAASGSPVSSTTTAMAVAGLGVVSLLGGFGVGELRRRRVVASS